ncbi:MAG: tetraacyldisaccharide 4'-kinase [Flavobacterium sp.]|nr:tetraacyldisaccharide 4'-kinase [Flavobacterium sp.]
MNILRKILFPVALVYWIITYIRNFLYDVGLFKSQFYTIPIIAVGNLSVGGTGKTPQIEYLIRLLKDYKIATLSRGYKRESKGFILANENATAKTLGDEPFQFYSKFPEVLVAVDANRKNGISELLKNKPEVILLDDAFQHRKVKAGFYILLTTFNDLFCDDYILPYGNLREPSLGKKRANLIIVTKCPKDLSELAQEKIKEKLKVSIPVYFSTIVYDDYVYSENGKVKISELNEEKVIKDLTEKIKEDQSFSIKFDSLEQISEKIFQVMKEKIK